MATRSSYCSWRSSSTHQLLEGVLLLLHDGQAGGGLLLQREHLLQLLFMCLQETGGGEVHSGGPSGPADHPAPPSVATWLGKVLARRPNRSRCGENPVLALTVVLKRKSSGSRKSSHWSRLSATMRSSASRSSGAVPSCSGSSCGWRSSADTSCSALHLWRSSCVTCSESAQQQGPPSQPCHGSVCHVVGQPGGLTSAQKSEP